MPNVQLRGCKPIASTFKRSFSTHGEVLRRYPLSLCTLAIESSCDDSSVAILERRRCNHATKFSHTDGFASLLFHAKVTADNRKNLGIDPVEALRSHQQNVSALVRKSFDALPLPVPGDFVLKLPGMMSRRKPDFISVTQGPGMRSNLSTGLDTAKGLAIAWGVPLVGVHHMQAHALTPRLKAALDRYPGSQFMYTDPASFERPTWRSASPGPSFPFLTLLVSGGHSMLLLSESLTDHKTLVSTRDIAVGEALDKIGREILPEQWLKAATDMAYARLLSEFAFPDAYNPTPQYTTSWTQEPSQEPSQAEEQDNLLRNPMLAYRPPQTRRDEWGKADNQFGWHVETPLSRTRELAFSFTGIVTHLTNLFRSRTSMKVLTEIERRLIAQTALTVAFEHLASKTAIALEDLAGSGIKISNLVVSGGVAANDYLQHVLRCFLDFRGHRDLNIIYPPASLCTDNAAMIAWAGMEMFESRYRSKLSCLPLRKWSMDSQSEDGGILRLGRYVEQDFYQYATVDYLQPQASHPISWSRATELHEAPVVLMPKDLIPYEDPGRAEEDISGDAVESYSEPFLERTKDKLRRDIVDLQLARKIAATATPNLLKRNYWKTPAVRTWRPGTDQQSPESEEEDEDQQATESAA